MSGRRGRGRRRGTERSSRPGFIIKPDGSRWVWSLLDDAYIKVGNSGDIPTRPGPPEDTLKPEDLTRSEREFYNLPPS